MRSLSRCTWAAAAPRRSSSRTAGGNVVKTFSATDPDSNGVVQLSWDGTNDQGQTVTAGQYTVSVTGGGSSGSAYAFTNGTVGSVNMSGNVTVSVDGMNFPLSNILNVSSGSSSD